MASDDGHEGPPTKGSHSEDDDKRERNENTTPRTFKDGEESETPRTAANDTPSNLHGNENEGDKLRLESAETEEMNLGGVEIKKEEEEEQMDEVSLDTPNTSTIFNVPKLDEETLHSDIEETVNESARTSLPNLSVSEAVQLVPDGEKDSVHERGVMEVAEAQQVDTSDTKDSDDVSELQLRAAAISLTSDASEIEHEDIKNVVTQQPEPIGRPVEAGQTESPTPVVTRVGVAEVVEESLEGREPQPAANTSSPQIAEPEPPKSTTPHPKTTVLHITEEKAEDTFTRLINGLESGSIENKTVVDSLFNVLVGGPFDLESRFIIEDSTNIERMLNLLNYCDDRLQAEIWSVFVAVVRKSNRNLDACSRVGLISKVLDLLPTAHVLLSDLLVQLLGVLTSYSITVKETKRFLRSLQAVNNSWPRNSLKLLQVMKEMPQKDGADVFFSFPGKAHAGICVPPLSRFPYQNGFTFSTWFRMDPLNSVTFEKEQPYLYCFRTAKGAGYSCHFTGNCLVINAEKAKGKVQSKCVKAELSPRKWHHVAIAHSYSRWTKGEIKCYLDGQLVETIDMNWACTASEHFDKCSIGISPEGDADSAFCGQMGAVYVFAESLSLQQANSLFCLGPTYQSSFKHDAESHLPDGYKKHLFDGRLNASLLMAYCPKNCHGQLCLHAPPKTTAQYFVQIPHAVMKQNVEVITTHSIDQSLQSVGGIQILLPLFSQLDLPYEDGSAVETDVCGTLLSLISLLLSSSQTSQQQLFHSKGFLIIAHALQRANSCHLSMSVVDRVIGMAKFLLRCPAGVPLLKQLFDHVLFNPRLWINAEPVVQAQLYQYMASDFLANANFPQILRRVPTVIEMMHSLKHYYYVVEPKAPSQYTVEPRAESFPNRDVVAIRGAILAFVNRLIVMNAEESAETNRDEEVHTLLNFIATVYEDDNLYDVLSLVTRLLADHPAILIPALDRNKALGVVFKLMISPNQLIRIPALKMLGYFLQRSTTKRKQDSVGQLNLFTLISERLLVHTTYLNIPTYNVLFEILVEHMTPSYSYAIHNPPTPEYRFENPTVLKVVATLIAQSEECRELYAVKKAFLLDMINMCRDHRENRRTILQMSVWQDWLISLSYVAPSSEAQIEISELVFEMFSILLHHAIRYEYGGWRVWVDSLAIAHSKVSWERHRMQSSSPSAQPSSPQQSGDSRESDGAADTETDTRATSPSDRPSPIYRTPEFCWSKVHLRLLSDLLTSIENVIDEWKQSSTPMIDIVNSSDQQVFVANTVHVISQLADSIIMACGGLLPLLASATSPHSELEISDASSQELPIESAAELLSRFVNLIDVFVFISGVSFAELEQEKNMPSGGVLRQTLRLVATASVRHILACRVGNPDSNSPPFDPSAGGKAAQIYKFVQGALAAQGKEGLQDLSRLLQEIDLQRIKGIVYRDMVEENRQAQFLALAVIYFLSVLMVSRYRDILEPPTSPSPFFNSTNAAGQNKTEESRRQSVVSNGATSPGEVAASSAVEGNPDSEEAEAQKEEEERAAEISAIRVAPGQVKKDGNEYKADELNKLSGGTRAPMEPGERRNYLTTKLQTALETTAPLLREVMSDFRSFLQKTLLGTHGQEIMNDVKVMETLKNKNGSVVELVMLLCSQEWQTSLQKHAGLAFIELVNEGRLMAHATRDHVLRVANEADFILNRIRAEDVSKHAQFESETGEQMLERREEESRCDHVISSSRRRDTLVAAKLLDKMITLLRSPSGAWATDKAENELFWRLDVWEDDSRRRKRFIPNVYGSRHEEAVLLQADSKGAEEDDLVDEEKRLRELAQTVAPGKIQLSELVDETDIDKWAAEVDPPPASESTSYSTPAKLIAPGLIVPGTLSITATDLYFDADEEDPLYKEQDVKVLRYCESLHGRWNLLEIRAVFLRRHLLQNIALELFLATRTAIMFAFPDQDTVKKVVYQLPRVGVGVKYGLPQSRKTSLMTPRQLFKHSDMCQKWQKREISNFDYLMFLNTVAGRTFNDLNQYPVFPWILTNYTSDTLDLNQASNFRDLSKPMGALSESRRKFFAERYQQWEDDTIPPFHYGTHYSTQAFTLNWLYRVEPFTSMFLHMQGGKFDHPDRMFHSMADTWERCQRDSHDVKELVPELFYLPEMMRNSSRYPLGKLTDGREIGDVILPAWAKSAEHFILLHRQALESDLVSCQLNQWIDLIFGYKQRGPEAVRATNVFYYLTYEGAVNIQSIENPTQAEAVRQQIQSFGQTPVQLLTEAHPPRHSVMSMTPMMFRRCDDDLCMLMKFISNSPVVYLAANTWSQLPNPTVLSIANNLVFALNRWDNAYTYASSRPSALAMNDKQHDDGPAHPMGALSESRRKFFAERYQQWEDDTIPPFHYGTHYSTQAFTLNWLYRVEPFTSMFLHMQGGKFDHPDRMFHSMADTWERCQRDSHDVKELVPELFYLPEMMRNSSRYPLGKLTDGREIGDVILPAWAKSAEHFILLHRQALESDLVSCQLNQWIDLIFGYKQRGPEAVRATNVFYYLTYEGAVNIQSIENPTQAEAVRQQIQSFGQTPVQLLTEAHPPRHSVMSMTPMMFRRCDDDLCMLMKFISNSPVVYLAANTWSQLPNPTVLSIANNLVFALNRWDNAYTYASSRPSALAMNDKQHDDGPAHVDLPLTVDPLLASGNPSQPPPRRHLGDSFDQRMNIKWNNFVSTTDSRTIIACGYPDYSFRVIDSDSATVRQVVYGHGDVVTCIARSETSLFADCYIATGSLDCTVALWHWNGQAGVIAGEYNLPGETPSPRAILTGHDAKITALAVSAEHGMVLSGCEDGTVLMHTTSGDLLRRVEGPDRVSLLLMSRECVVFVLYGRKHIQTLSTTARQLDEQTSTEPLECGCLTRDGEYVVAGSDSGRVHIYRLFPLQHLYSFQQTDSPVRCVSVSANHRFIVGGLDSGAVVVFNVDFNKWHYEYKHRYAENKR